MRKEESKEEEESETIQGLPVRPYKVSHYYNTVYQNYPLALAFLLVGLLLGYITGMAFPIF